MQSKIQKSENRSALPALFRYWLPAVVAALVIGSCIAASPPDTPSNRQLPMDTIWAGRQCGCEARQPRVRWVTDRDQLAAAVAAAKSTDLETQVTQHPVDWKRDGIVWLDMGLKPSGGYALSLAAPAATVTAGIAVITVKWRQPRPESVVTQQLTSPCLLIRLARDHFHTIRIKDETGRVRAGLEVNNN
jgi:hypothetical protein